MSLLGPVLPSVREEKSASAKSGELGRGGMLDHTDRFGSKKLLHIQRAVGGRVVMHVVSELLVSDMAHAPTDVSFFLNNSSCLLLVPAGTNWQWIIPPAASGGGKKCLHCLDTRFLQPDFLLPGRIRSTPFHASSFRFRMELKTPAFITSHNSLQHVAILVTKLYETATTFNPMHSLFSR